jgi:hypothetical protein
MGLPLSFWYDQHHYAGLSSGSDGPQTDHSRTNELKVIILFLDLQLYGRTKNVFVYITDTAVGYFRINSRRNRPEASHIIPAMQRFVGNGPERSIAFYLEIGGIST